MLIEHGQTYCMNHWAHKQLPFSWQPKDIRLQWSGSDHADSLYNNSQKDAWNNIDISYQYNAQGYRTKDLIGMYDKKVDIALGCSLTEGIGLPIGGTWPSLVEESRDYPMLNLGIQCGSTDTVARMLTNCMGLFDIQQVFILWPDFSRFEIYHEDHVEPVIPSTASTKHVWFMDKETSQNRFYKNQLLIHSLGVNVVELIAETVFNPKSRGAPDKARDGQHYGYQSQRIVSWEFIKALTAK